MNYGVEAVSLRYFSVYGPRQRPDMAFNRFCRAATVPAGVDGSQLTVYGDGKQTRDFTFVADVVRATVAAAISRTAVGCTYNIGGGSQVSVNDAIALISEFSGNSLNVRHLPPQPGDVRRTGADTKRARRDLRYKPLTDVRTGLGAEFQWIVSDTDNA